MAGLGRYTNDTIARSIARRGITPTPGPSAGRSPSAAPTTMRPLGQGPTLESLGINVQVVQFKTGSIDKFIQEHRKDETEELKEFSKRLKSNNITTMYVLATMLVDDSLYQEALPRADLYQAGSLVKQWLDL